MSRIAITNVTIFDGSGAAPFKGEVLIEDTRIVEVARAPRQVGREGARAIDGAGRFLMPGMTEAHTHFLERPALARRDQFMPPEEHILWCVRVASALPGNGLDLGHRAAAASRAWTWCCATRSTPESARGALPGGQPGNHHDRRAGRQHAAAHAVRRTQLRQRVQRPRRDPALGAHVHQVRRRSPEDQSVRRVHRGPAGRDVALRGRRDRHAGRRGQALWQARGGPRALQRIGQAVRAPRHRNDLSRQLCRRRGARHAGGQQG